MILTIRVNGIVLVLILIKVIRRQALIKHAEFVKISLKLKFCVFLRVLVELLLNLIQIGVHFAKCISKFRTSMTLLFSYPNYLRADHALETSFRTLVLQMF